MILNASIKFAFMGDRGVDSCFRRSNNQTLQAWRRGWVTAQVEIGLLFRDFMGFHQVTNQFVHTAAKVRDSINSHSAQPIKISHS
jgi:hypothetical protein